jgi:hypothetical protein
LLIAHFVDGLQHLLPGFSPQLHAGSVDDNAGKPRRHLRATLELREMAQSGNKSILDCVLRIRVIAKLTKRDMVEET